MNKITKILSKPYKQFFRYRVDVEYINEKGKLKVGEIPSTSLEYIKKCKIGNIFNYAEAKTQQVAPDKSVGN